MREGLARCGASPLPLNSLPHFEVSLCKCCGVCIPVASVIDMRWLIHESLPPCLFPRLPFSSLASKQSTSICICHVHEASTCSFPPSHAGFFRTYRVRGRRVPRHSPWCADRTLLG
eukprot:561088-Pleurochrysis_carterae.AAC.2